MLPEPRERTFLGSHAGAARWRVKDAGPVGQRVSPMTFSLHHVVPANGLLDLCQLPLSEGSINLGLFLLLVVVVGVTLCHWAQAPEMLDMGLPVRLNGGPGDTGPVSTSGWNSLRTGVDRTGQPAVKGG